MLFDFERLYIWRRRRFFFSPEEVWVVLPKELDIPSMVQFWHDFGAVKFGNDFKKYIEWFDGRLAGPDDMPVVIDTAQIDPEASKKWMLRGVDTKKIGVKEFYPIEDEIADNEKRTK